MDGSRRLTDGDYDGCKCCGSRIFQRHFYPNEICTRWVMLNMWTAIIGVTLDHSSPAFQRNKTPDEIKSASIVSVYPRARLTTKSIFTVRYKSLLWLLFCLRWDEKYSVNAPLENLRVLSVSIG